MKVRVLKPYKNQHCHDCGRALDTVAIEMSFKHNRRTFRLCSECFLENFEEHNIGNYYDVKSIAIEDIEEHKMKQKMKDARAFM